MKVGVVGNARYKYLPDVLDRLGALAPKLDCSIVLESDLHEFWNGRVEALDDHLSELDVLLTMGGDGTLLRGARKVVGTNTPILGVNMGRVGFLTAAGADALEDALKAFAAGRHKLESRRALTSTIQSPDGESDREFTLNDVVVHKGGVARVLRFRVSVDGEEVGRYSADGIIIATPTGSTAYSLSAGGPIVVPGVDALVITAICPHTLAVRPIVVSASAEIRIEQIIPYTDAVLVSYDGQSDAELEPGSVLCVREWPNAVQLVRLETEGFFDRVRSKLQWGDLSDRERD